MSYLIICITALLASGLTLFSGFGLGTVLLPAFALFFPIELAIAMTAIVHLANNLFKFALLGRMADWSVVLRFGIPAIAAAILGAWVLTLLSDLRPLHSYRAFGREFHIMPVKLIIAALMAGFAMIDLTGKFERSAIPPKYLPIGGLLSGFFGGLSGHQGALRSAFLIKAGLSKGAFIATGVVIACMIDLGRLAVYASDLRELDWRGRWPLIAAATWSAFAGVWIGTRLIGKVTIRQIQILVAVMLIVIAIGLAMGLI